MASLAEMQEKRSKLAATIKEVGDAFHAQDKAWKDEEQRGVWEQVNADYDAVLKEIETEEARSKQSALVADRLRAVEDQMRTSRNVHHVTPGFEDRSSRRDATDHEHRSSEAMRAWMLSSCGHDISDEQRSLMKQMGYGSGGSREISIGSMPTGDVQRLQFEARSVHASRIPQIEQRSLNTYTASGAGALVPSIFLNRLEVNQLYFGGVRRVAELLVTDGRGELSWPSIDGTNMSATIVGEGTTLTEGTEPTVKTQKWNAYKWKVGPIKVTREMLNEPGLNFASLLGGLMGEALGRGTNAKHTTGTGTGEPHGIVTASALGVTTSGAFDYDDVLTLQHSVDIAYRNQPGVGFMMSDTVFLGARLLKDGENQYLWQNGIDIGRPDMFAGYPLSINNDMTIATSTGSKVMLFGRLSDYKIRRVQGVRMQRLIERYADADQDGFLAFVEEDGNLLNAGTPTVKHMIIGA